MNEWLAQYFGTAPVSEETEKQASAELFVKLAMENGIDLNAMTDAEVAELYESTMGKMAEDEGSEEEKKKVEEAKKEHEEKKESAAKFAEAVFMGQTMAHAFTAELDAIEKGAAKNPYSGIRPEAAGKARRLFEKGKAHATEFGARLIGSKTREAEKALANLKNREGHVAGGAKLEGSMAKHIDKLRSESRKARIGAGAAAGGAAAIGGGAYAATRDKKSSALDEMAAEAAVAKVASAGWDVDEAIDRIGAILTLGVDDENSKVAFAQTLEQAVEVRSLELAEAAGYPINWPE